MAQSNGSEEASDESPLDRSGARIISLPRRDGRPIPVSHPEGVPAALTATYLAERDQIYRFLLRRTGCAETARDLLHEVWLRVARLEDMPTPTRPAAYLQRIAANLALDHVRKVGFRASWVHESDDIDRARDDAPDLERVLHARSAVAHLRDLVDRLPDGRRRVFLLCEIDGLTARQAADRLGISHRTVETQYAKAIATLRQGLAEASLWP